jgi:hypothetical protein
LWASRHRIGEKTMTTAFLRCACLIVLATSSAGVQREARQRTSQDGIVRGRIVAADTGAPIRDAIVSLRPADVVPAQFIRVFGPTRDTGGVTPTKEDTELRAAALKAVRSAGVDASGEFELAGVVPGRYRLAVDPGVSSARYLPARFPDPASDDPTPLTVGPGQVIDKIVIALPRAAAISGRIVDENGNPMALVSVLAQEVLPGDRRRPALGFAANLPVRSDDNGAFRLFGLRPGEYILVAQPVRTSGMWMEPAGVTMTSAPAAAASYFPGTASAAEATPIRVGTGAEHGPVEFTVAPLRLHKVRGMLLDPAGQPVSYVSVSLKTQAGGQFSSTTRPDATFEIANVPGGDYALTATRYGIGAGSQAAWMPLDIHADIDGLVVRLQQTVTVSGHALFDGPPPSPAAMSELYVRSVPTRSGALGGSAVALAPDRSFALENQFGPTLIRTDGLPGWYLKAVIYGGRDVTDQPVEFEPGRGSLQVVLTQGGATLSGVVTTPANVPADASVLVFAEDPALWMDRASQTRSAMTGATGRYRLGGLRAGRYLAVAVMLEDGPVFNQSPAWFELLAKYATPVVLGDGESKTLDLKRVILR